VPPAKAPVPTAPAKEEAPAPAAPAKPAAKEEAKQAPAAQPAKVAAPPAPSKEAAPGKEAAAPPGPAEKAAPPAKAEAKPAEKPAPSSYSLQIGAMVMEENATALKRKLDAGGFPAVIRKGKAYVAKQVVTVGEPSGKREAEDLSRRLNVDGFPSQLLAAGGKYTPQIGAFYNENEAIDLARELQKKNYLPKISSKPTTTTVYQVRHGKFDSRAAAVRRGEELKGKGFSFLVVRE
jgi:cell division septation protein DedD